MKKTLILLVFLLIVLAACENRPEPVDLNATVQSIVSTELAPVKEQMGDFVTSSELEESQAAQNRQIQQYIAEHMDDGSAQRINDDDFNEDFEERTQRNIIPTITPIGGISTDQMACINSFAYDYDVTIPDGMTITPNTIFTKSWHVTNTGTCTWNSNYKLVYYSGDQVGKSKSFQLVKTGYVIQPGESATISAELVAPYKSVTEPARNYETYWALESDKGEQFGGGAARNVYLSSKFRLENQYSVIQNFASLICSDQEGYIPCGVMDNGEGRGSVYYDETPMNESRRSQGAPGIVAVPSSGPNGGIVRFEFGPLRFPRGSTFYTNFCCRPDSPTCDVQVRLYVREPGYEEQLVQETREWYDGFMGEWKSILDDIGVFDQEFYYIVEVETNGGSDNDDRILFINTRIY